MYLHRWAAGNFYAMVAAFEGISSFEDLDEPLRARLGLALQSGAWPDPGVEPKVSDFASEAAWRESWRAWNDENSRQQSFDAMRTALSGPRWIGMTVLLASYDREWSGDAFVLFEREGRLWEVNATHRSGECLGPWEPEETTVDALRHRLQLGELGKDPHGVGNSFDAELERVLKSYAPPLLSDTTAREAYNADHANCSAYLGVYLFRDGADVPDKPQAGEPLQVCTGPGTWVSCERGLPDLVALVASELDAMDEQGLAPRDLPDEWGIVCNAAGEVTHRAFPTGQIREVTYLGMLDGPLASEPLNLTSLGLGPKPARPAQRP